MVCSSYRAVISAVRFIELLVIPNKHSQFIPVISLAMEFSNLLMNG